MNEILYKGYEKCCSAGFSSLWSVLQQEELKIKKSLKDSTSNIFTALSGWLEKWKAANH